MLFTMRPAWGFVSKQLKIQSSESRVFRVNTLAPFRTALAQAIQGEYVPSHPSEKLGTADYGGFLRLESGRGLLALVQNPFLRFVREDRLFEISYQPEMDWNPAWGPFESDRGILAPYSLSGRAIPAQMHLQNGSFPRVTRPRGWMHRRSRRSRTWSVRLCSTT